MASGPETQLVKKIVAELERRGCVVEKMHGSRFTTTGMPDLIGVLPGGRALAVEVKRPDGGRVSLKQLHELWRWAEAGAVVIGGARSVDDVVRIAFGD